MLAKEKIQAWRENDLDVDIRKQWMDHIGGVGPSQFPRDVGFPVRYPVEDIHEMIDEVNKHRKSSNSYVQVFSEIQRAADVYDTFYVDLDADMPFEKDEGTEEERWAIWEEELEDTYWELRKYSWHMEQAYDTELRVYFSGSRGFSIYVDFPEVEADWLAVIDIVKQTLQDANVDMDVVDESVYDKTANRISRLPYTLNWNHMQKRGLDPMFCLPIDPTWSFDTLLAEIKDPIIQLPVIREHDAHALKRDIENRDRDEDFEATKIETETKVGNNPERSLERVKVLMNLAEHIGDGRHRILHFMLVPALIEAGWESKDKIHEVCQEFIEATGASYRPEYYKHVENTIPRTIEGPDGSDSQWKPWTIATFLGENPGLLKYFDATELD